MDLSGIFFALAMPIGVIFANTMAFAITVVEADPLAGKPSAALRPGQ